MEIPLPDQDCRRRLVNLYRGGLELAPKVREEVVSGTEGVTASFIKELLRRAALLAAEADGAGEFRRITREQARSALERLLAERNRLTRVLLGGEAPQAGAGVGGAGAEMPMPAPVARVGSVVISSFD
ncbi:MAG: hypothetical protein ACREOD_09840 [Candidatus Dormibacteria bacterium]